MCVCVWMFISICPFCVHLFCVCGFVCVSALPARCYLATGCQVAIQTLLKNVVSMPAAQRNVCAAEANEVSAFLSSVFIIRTLAQQRAPSEDRASGFTTQLLMLHMEVELL